MNCTLLSFSMYGNHVTTVFSAGKDITHKLYSLNEHLGAMANDLAARALGRPPDHWRSINRSLSVDAVHTGTRGHVRSVAWRSQQQRRTSATYSDSKLPPFKWLAFGLSDRLSSLRILWFPSVFQCKC
jgi:hypothetical protein